MRHQCLTPSYLRQGQTWPPLLYEAANLGLPCQRGTL